ncbi:hypothetical protein PMAYCL1PPCAC_19170 [Pristionchus mayeri]|uniref:Uncharacterized protein n=1 Tax=Pristionchus mayeri TaxID=1317129 RepID=A0AAN5I2D6_9BILA|nr:hypothetical protein PMAYCL1PPCAC_19170 [Pristionchus mayeri]
MGLGLSPSEQDGAAGALIADGSRRDALAETGVIGARHACHLYAIVSGCRVDLGGGESLQMIGDPHPGGRNCLCHQSDQEERESVQLHGIR